MSEWSNKDILKLALMYFNGESDLHIKMDRPFAEVAKKLSEFNWNERSRWTEWEDEVINNAYPYIGRRVRLILPWRTEHAILNRSKIVIEKRLERGCSFSLIRDWYFDNFCEEV